MPNSLIESSLLVDSREAARMLAVSPRTLWSLSSPRGPVPVVKIGRAVRFKVADLERFVEAAKVEAKEVVGSEVAHA